MTVSVQCAQYVQHVQLAVAVMVAVAVTVAVCSAVQCSAVQNTAVRCQASDYRPDAPDYCPVLLMRLRCEAAPDRITATTPDYSPDAPDYSLDAPDFSSNAPVYSPDAPDYSPDAPDYSLDAPDYSILSTSLRHVTLDAVKSRCLQYRLTAVMITVQ